MTFDEILDPLKAIRIGIIAISNGFSICLFPEGNRSYYGNLQEFKKGIFYITKNTNVPVYPVFINGTFDAWPRFKKWPVLFKKVDVLIGTPIYYSHSENNNDINFLMNLKKSLINLSKMVEKK